MTRTLTAMLLTIGLCTVVAAAQDGARRTTSSAASPASLINLNTATAAQLETLPGIGKSTAERIIEYRQKNGAFKKVEDLMNVRGIGEKSFLKLKPMLTVAASKGDRAEP